MTALAAGCILGGAALGGFIQILTAQVSVHVTERQVAALLCALFGLAAALDFVFGSATFLPRSRQVSANWLHSYRGVVYGIGYGVQFGIGLATIVTTVWVYAFIAASFVSGLTYSHAAPWLAGVAFGVGRAAMVMPGRSVYSVSELMALNLRFAERGSTIRRAANGLAFGVSVGIAATVMTF